MPGCHLGGKLCLKDGDFLSKVAVPAGIMKISYRFFLLLILSTFASSGLVGAAEQYANIAPEWRCHYPMKDRSFCKVFPNIAVRRNICNPAPEVIGNIEWSREEVTVSGTDAHGNYETYKAVAITYRPVYENGAWGKKFVRTYRIESTYVVPPIVGK